MQSTKLNPVSLSNASVVYNQWHETLILSRSTLPLLRCVFTRSVSATGRSQSV